MRNNQERETSAISDRISRQFLAKFKKMDQRDRLDYLTVLLRKIDVSISISIDSNHQRDTKFIQNYPSRKSIYPSKFRELNKLLNELSEEYQLDCIFSILHSYPVTLIIGAFDTENENSENEPGINGSILPITATDHIVENVHNGMRVSQQQHQHRNSA